MDSTMQVDDEIQLILNELKAEEQKYDSNNILQKELEDISIICFTKNIESIVEKLLCVTVKVCDSYTDLEALEICNDKYNEIINSKTSCYVIQIFVSNVFQNKLMNSNWIANVSINNQFKNVCKSIYLKNLIPSEVFNILIPFAKSVKPAVVETKLFFPTDENFWPSIKISTIQTDISYHFVPMYAHKILQLNKTCPLYEISKLYTSEIKLRSLQPIFKYRFLCKSHIRNLFESVLKHCVHKLDINHMQTLTTATDGAIDLNLFVSNSESSVSLDTANQVLNISANAELLHRIKGFLIVNTKEENVSVNPDIFIKLQNLRTRLHEERCKIEINFETVKALYEEYKNLIAELPV